MQSPYHRALLALVALHILVITVSNYLVQFPFTLWGLHTTWGAFTFPFIFLATDLTVRLLGAPLARQVIARVMIPALLISYGVSTAMSQEPALFNLAIARIALASFLAYLLGQLLDIQVFNRLRQYQWWLAPLLSTVVGNLADTLVFFAVAFYGSSNAFMAIHWLAIALFDYGFKLLISLLCFLPLYGWLLERLLQRRQSLAWTMR
ncbi:7-cyano-7-deazaguanine/7-aminomethyl-7-deazaguanine transporter [Gallaecimonas sp. GXIMD1310]|uniref:7-cyano-7-deazaguanine/7-aminomethyl-7- deazaguanine transporter n=1 Tax=Gallaecimonas sp. GXIMD1310 TaxID=3131926 RepID=UPI00324DEA6C